MLTLNNRMKCIALITMSLLVESFAFVSLKSGSFIPWNRKTVFPAGFNMEVGNNVCVYVSPYVLVKTAR
jgi:hypothetical protein